MQQLERGLRRTKHAELTDTLRAWVRTLSPGERLPSQTELMRRYRVSDRTVLRSLDDLRRDGWIVRRQGSGTYVAEQPPADQLRSLAAQHRTVAVVAQAPSPSPFYQRCLDLLAEMGEAGGWSLLCHHAGGDPTLAEPLPLEALEPRGFVLFNYALYPLACRLRERGHRAVLLGPPPVDVLPEVPCVYGDHDEGAYLATRHLLELGHRRIAFLRITESSTTPGALQRTFRWRGHQRALAEAQRGGLVTSTELIRLPQVEEWRADAGALRHFFRRPGAPTAVACWNDSEAIVLLGLLQHAGISVPGEVSLIGYDSLPVGEQCMPQLTTVDQHLRTQLRAVLDLLGRDEPPPGTQSVVVVPTLVVRGSCGPPSP